MDVDLLGRPGSARPRDAGSAFQPDQRAGWIALRGEPLRIAFLDNVAIGCDWDSKRRSLRVDGRGPEPLRAVGHHKVRALGHHGDGFGYLSRLASSLGSMLPPLTTATVRGPGGSCSSAA